MSVKTATISLDDKLAVTETLIRAFRDRARNGDQNSILIYESLKSIAADLHARQAFPTSNALGELRRKIERVQASKTALGYDEGRLTDLANHVINKWPFISQALERFGEESAE